MFLSPKILLINRKIYLNRLKRADKSQTILDRFIDLKKMYSMDTELIIIKDYCDRCHVDPQFIFELENDGLITVHEVNEERYISSDQLSELECYLHLYYDLEININGIDAIRHMLNRIESMQKEILFLKNQLSFFNR